MTKIDKVRQWSRKGKVTEEDKAWRRNWEAIWATIRSYAKEGSWHAYYRGYIYEENLVRLELEGFHVEKQMNPLGSIRWYISWEN